MQAELIEDAPVLIPNKEHQNFTRNGQVIPKGEVVEGEIKVVQGKRRGEPFTYELFYTNKNQFIHKKKVKPMATTQVYLSADAQQTPTIVDVPQNNLLTTPNIVGAVAGYLVGNWYSRKYGKGNPRYFGLAGAVAGVLVARYMTQKGTIKFVKSK
jgi:hypothetical protein